MGAYFKCYRTVLKMCYVATVVPKRKLGIYYLSGAEPIDRDNSGLHKQVTQCCPLVHSLATPLPGCHHSINTQTQY